MKPATIGEILDNLVPGVSARKGLWPPDIFATAAHLLERSGAYIQVANEWPPKGSPKNWAVHIDELGHKWRTEAKAPREVVKWWNFLLRNRSVHVAKIRSRKKLWQTLAQLCATSDQASRGVGLPGAASAEKDEFSTAASLLMFEGLAQDGATSLAVSIDRSKLVVLPKVHTPQKGITIRSLSHNLALCSNTDVCPQWWEVWSPHLGEAGTSRRHGLTILLLPHPTSVSPAQFSPWRRHRADLHQMPKAFGFFDYRPERLSRRALMEFQRIVLSAEKLVGPVDGVVLPEMALLENDYRRLCKGLLGKVSFVISGVCRPSSNRGRGENFVNTSIFFANKRYATFTQHKHHRWALDEGQICQYGLGSMLDPTIRWWENTSLERRSLNFFSFTDWLSMCVLVCEDLARPDPVGDVLRAVAPNLVIALLQDGPQIQSRWSSRCATVLADDPGSSILTLTSLGMSRMSRPIAGERRERVVALWRDKNTPAQELSLPIEASGIVMCLTTKREPEWTADGRRDTAPFIKLAGWHPVE